MRVFPFVILSIVVVAGALAWQQGLIGAAAQAPKPKAPPPPIPVIATAVKTEDVPVYGEGIGTVQASNTITVKVRVDGELTKVVFKEGQEVKAGDILAQIDQRPFAAALAQAKAARAKDEALLANAKADYDRYKVLVPKQAASQQQLDTQSALVAQYQAQIAGDEAAIDTAQIQLDYTTIRAPISGRTGVRLVDEGNIVHANDEGGLVVITQLKPVAVVFTLPQDRLDDMQAALARGPVSALAFRRDGVTKVGEGTVALIDNQISSDTGTLRIKAVFPNDDLKLWPGAFVNVKVLLDTHHDVVTIPAQAIQRGPDGFYVYVVKPDATVEKRAVTTSGISAGIASIATGIAAGDQVVIDGQYKLIPGARVTVRPPPATPPARSVMVGAPA